MDRYIYFIRHALGGSADVPVVLLEEANKWRVPTKRSRVGREEVSFTKEMEESVSTLMKELITDIKMLGYPSEYPSHELMVERMIDTLPFGR
jgi:hypothetical protein